MSFSLAPLVIQMPAIAASKGASFSNSNQHPKLPSLINHQHGKSKDLVGICLRKPKPCSSTRRKLCCKSQLADFAPVTSAAYGVLLFSGGLFAFTKSGSKGSLFGGLTGAALMTSVYFLMQSSETKAFALGFGSAFLFSSVFGMFIFRFFYTIFRDDHAACAQYFRYISCQFNNHQYIEFEVLSFSLSLVTVLGIRLVATRKLIPAGPLLGLSICALVVFTSAYLQDSL
ncbi:hypothetical protein REPUB_Repub08aG0150900 [Reevesia pubescens]